MKAVTFDKVTLGGYWKNRFDINKASTIPNVYNRFSETGRFDAFKFEWKDGDPKQPHIFWDSDVAKWIEAVAYAITKCPDKELENIVDGVVDLIEKNQDENGYFNIYFTVCEPDNRFVNRMAHELYCAGHLTEAAVAYFKATGKRKFMTLMEKYLEHIEKVFIIDDSAEFCTPGHEEIELALVKLYDCTGNERYLEMSRHFVDARGTREKDEESPYYISHAYDQTHMPVRDMEVATGHSVRAVYLYCAMADLAKRLGDEKLLTACNKLFDSIAQKQMYITGGIGSTSYGEAFTEDYDLPNDVAYSETCASIGLALFARRMSLIEADSRYADAAETAIYNCALAGVSLDGKAFFYVNPLEINLERHRKNKQYYQFKGNLLTERVEVFDCSCCPPNIARFIASIGDFLYTYDENTVYTHHYFESETEFDGIKIAQNTVYPNDGEIKITVKGMAGKTLAVRIPGWAEKYSIDAPVAKTEKGYAYIEIDADEKEISLGFPMECRLVMANPAVEANVGRVALCRGPLVYCAERIDNGNTPLNNLSLSTEINATLAFDETMQANTIEVDGFEDAQFDALYRSYSAEKKQRRIRFIPYYAFANRGESDMLIWFRI